MNKLLKPILLVPMAGLGKRFKDKGIFIPKPFITVDDKQIIDYSFNSINKDEYEKIIFIIRQEHVNNFKIDRMLRDKFGNSIEIIVIPNLTEGSVVSCRCAENLIDNEHPLVIYTLDVSFEPKFKFSDIDKNLDGLILTFQSNSENYSYVQKNHANLVIKTAEKEVISSDAAVGIYVFASGHLFIKYSDEMITNKLKTNGEYYISPLYNLLIQDGLKIGTQQVDKMHVIGTPEEVEFYKKNVSPKFGVKPIALCCDHSGYDLKEKFKGVLREQGFKFIDFGTYTDKDCDYTDYVKQACEHLNDGFCDFGFGFCRSGQGVNIAANKTSGIRSALIYDNYVAEHSIRHNCANFFCIPTHLFSSEKEVAEILEIISNNTFDGGRHTVRVQKMEIK